MAAVDLEKVDIVTLAYGFHMRIDDEDIILTVIDPCCFASELEKRMK